VVVAATDPDFFRWVPHPEVWLLVVSLAVLYTYAGRVIGPKVVPAGTPPVSRSQWRWFTFGILLLWLAADWPMHDIGEEYLYLVHMTQHLLLTLVVPAVMLLATPTWLARLVVGDGEVDRWVHRLARPVPAGIAFSALTLVTHAQIVVNTSADNGLFHYGVHTALVTSALLFWIPVCGPFPELRISPPSQMIYLFVASIVPTVPGAWLTFAEGAVYSSYDISARLWGISVTSDQQVAGLLMKLVGGTFLWVIIAIVFFRWASDHEAGSRASGTLTYDEVQREFDEHPAPLP
jgi:putative membrane protein